MIIRTLCDAESGVVDKSCCGNAILAFLEANILRQN